MTIHSAEMRRPANHFVGYFRQVTDLPRASSVIHRRTRRRLPQRVQLGSADRA